MNEYWKNPRLDDELNINLDTKLRQMFCVGRNLLALEKCIDTINLQ